MDEESNVDLTMSFVPTEMSDDMNAMEEGTSYVLKEQDRFLPIANVTRIMKKGIPKTGKVIYFIFIHQVKTCPE